MMSVSVREQLKALQFLQEIDSKAEGLKKQKTVLTLQMKPLQEKLALAGQKIIIKSREIEEAQKFERQAVAAIDICQDRLTRSSTRMETISKGNEFSALTREIDQLKKQMETLKVQSQKAKEGTVAKQTELTQLQAEQVQVQQELDQIQTQLDTEAGKLDETLADLNVERATHTGKVDSRVLLQYDRIRNVRAGLGLTPTVDGRCRACNVMLPPQLYIQIQRAIEFHKCPNCGRLLFFSENKAQSPSQTPVIN